MCRRGAYDQEGLVQVSLTRTSKPSPGSTLPGAAGSHQGFNSDPPAWLDLVVSWLEPLRHLKDGVVPAFTFMWPPSPLGSYLLTF